jgi:alpha-N-arabinofuranosidase
LVGRIETNAFGTHEFFDFAEQLGTDTYVAINMATATPAVMRDWMDYLTSKGEDTLAQERRANGHAALSRWISSASATRLGAVAVRRLRNISNEYRKFATFFHKNGSTFHMHNDNSALRVASGPNNDDTKWMEVVLKNAGQQMDAISLHYTVWHGDWAQRDTAMATGFPVSHWNEILYQASRMDEVLRGHEAVMDKVDPKSGSACSSTNGAHGIAPNRAPNRGICISRTLCATRWWRGSRSTYSTPMPTACAWPILPRR